MEIFPIFSVGIGVIQDVELLEVARELFRVNDNKMRMSVDGLHTTLKNYNSPDNCCLLDRPDLVKIIEQRIVKNTRLYYEKLGFDVETLNFEVTNLWLNKMEKGGVQPRHMHYGSQVSGCFYVNLPVNSNQITFCSPLKRIEYSDHPIKDFSCYNASVLKYHPEEGDMIFWSSLLEHLIPALEFEGVRHSIAYDLQISKNTNHFLGGHIMNIQDYVGVYNMNNPKLCEQLVDMLQNSSWGKHTYISSPVTNEVITYEDDLDITYESNDLVTNLEKIFEKCIKHYIDTVPSTKFIMQNTTNIRFNRYNVGTNMKMHCDHIHSIFDGSRKGIPTLSVLALLNDDFEGGNFVMFDNKKVNLSKGDIIIFPSNFMFPHGVTTVTKGTRYSCVSWVF